MDMGEKDQNQPLWRRKIIDAGITVERNAAQRTELRGLWTHQIILNTQLPNLGPL